MVSYNSVFGSVVIMIHEPEFKDKDEF